MASGADREDETRDWAVDWATLEDMRDEVERRRKRGSGALVRVEGELAFELASSSVALDGGTLTDEEALRLLREGVCAPKPFKHHAELLDQVDAIEHIQELALDRARVQAEDIIELHSMVMWRSAPDLAGDFRSTPAAVEGSLASFPAPDEIGPLMGDLLGWLAGAPVDAKTAFGAHFRFVSIHPFADGNGRTARLLMNLLLLQAGYPLMIVRSEHKKDYWAAIEARQLGGPSGPHESFLAQRLMESLQRCLDAA